MSDPTRDPIHQLESFSEGLTVTPLSPSEVRRRGDRLRRRNSALAAVAAAAVVAVIATPFAVIADNREDSGPTNHSSVTDSPTPTNSAPQVPQVHEIPDDFPITAGAAAADGSETKWRGPSRATEGVFLPVLCGTTAWPPASQDSLGLNVTGPEYADDRTLVTFADADQAVAAVQAIRDATEACPAQQNALFDVLTADTGYDSFTLGSSYTDGLGSDAWQFTRVGRAVLAVHTYGEGTRQSLPLQAREITKITGKITPAMCAYTAAGCDSSSADPSQNTSQVLGPDGYGDLKLGMTAAEVDATGLATLQPYADPGAACQTMSIAGWGQTVNPTISGDVHGFVSKLHGLAIIYAQPGMHTPEGIGVGSTVAEVKAAYGDLTGSDAYNTTPVNGISYFFLTDGAKVTAFQIELADEDCVGTD
jgi:hypothetical protein